MKQVLHLLVVDRDRRTALAAWHGGRWILPIVCCHERARAGIVVKRWLGQQGLTGDVAGQWVGRLAATGDAIDWLMIVRSRMHSQPVASASLIWRSIESHSASASWIAYQQWAVDRVASSADIAGVPGPFGTLTWPDVVTAWVVEACRVRWVGEAIPYRVTAHEVVVGFDTCRGRVFFKGLTGARSREARATMALAVLAPTCFAGTLALERRADGSVWWLTDACRGTPLSQCLSPAAVERTAAAYADVQQLTLESAVPLETLDVSTALEWCTTLLQQHCSGDIARPCSSALEGACADVATAAAPHAWIALDLDPANVLLDGLRGVRFIDLDDSFAGPAPLAVATLARRTRRIAVTGEAGLLADRIYQAYEGIWPRMDLSRCPWRTYEIVSALVDAYLGWGCVVANTERHEVYGAIDAARARLAERLVRAAGTAAISA